MQSRYACLIIAGLIFSLFGDVMLVFINNNNFFKAGLAFFLITQVIYGAASTVSSGVYVLDYVIVMALMTILILAYKELNMDVGNLKIPVLLYVLAITYMLSKAISLLYNSNIPFYHAILAASGAFLFFVSDAILAVNKFYRVEFKAFRAINLITYYLGQMLIALSIFYLNQ